MNLTRALPLAEQVKQRLMPHCERIDIAGSIRRRRDWVNDIDLVILPHSETDKDLIRLKIRSSCDVVTEGDQNCIYRMPLKRASGIVPEDHSGTSGRMPEARSEEIQLDLFFARPAQQDLLSTVPSNFGSLLLCRTGSREHNIFLVEHAKRRGLVWKPYAGVCDADGRCLAAETEGEIFEALGLEFIDPEKRER